MANPNGGIVYGNANLTVAIQAYDGLGNPAAYQKITFTSTQPFERFTFQPSMTDVEGRFTSTLAASIFGSRKLTATIGTIKRTANLQFAARAPVCAGKPSFNGLPGILVAGEPNTTAAKLAGVRLIDINRDGAADLVVLNQSQNALLTYRSVGNGTFAAPVTYALGCQPNAMVARDFGNDNAVDFAVGCNNANYVVILTNDGNGLMTASTTPSVNRRTGGLAAGFVDNDNLVDLVSFDPNSGAINVLRNSGSGFVVGPTQTVAGIRVAAVADMTGDNVGDVVAACTNANTVRLLKGSPDTSLAAPVTVLTGNAPTDLAVGRIDADSRADLVVKFAGGANDVVACNTNDGTGNVVATSYLPGGSGSLRLVDWNGDGSLDVLGVPPSARQGQLYLASNDGAGNFSTTYLPLLLKNAPLEQVAVGDINGDGRLDVATAMAGFISLQLAQPDHTLTAPKTVAGPRGVSMTVADFDGDGHLDLAGPVFSRLQWAYGDGTGNFPRTGLSQFSFPGGGSFALCRYASAVDVNGDGRVDVVGTTDDANNRGVVAWINDANATFSQQVFSSAQVQGIPAFGDIDGDGIVDAVVPHSSLNGNYAVMRGNGAGSFTVVSIQNAGFSASVTPTLADFTGDGTQDLAISFSGSRPPRVYRNDGSGTFSFSADLTTNSVTAIIAADLNGDGKMDLAVLSPTDGFATYLGNGDATFQSPFTLSAVNVLSNFFNFSAGDFNGDGFVDLTVTNSGIGILPVFLGRGDGTFELRGHYSAGTQPRWTVAEDFDEDGLFDLAVAGPADTTIIRNAGCL